MKKKTMNELGHPYFHFAQKGYAFDKRDHKIKNVAIDHLPLSHYSFLINEGGLLEKLSRSRKYFFYIKSCNFYSSHK